MENGILNVYLSKTEFHPGARHTIWTSKMSIYAGIEARVSYLVATVGNLHSQSLEPQVVNNEDNSFQLLYRQLENATLYLTLLYWKYLLYSFPFPFF